MLNKYFCFLFILLNLLVSSCSEGNPKNSNNASKNRDLDSIVSQKKLRVLIENNPVSYFIYRGKPMGFEYEILDLFAEHLKVDLELIMINDLDEMIPKLKNGEGDLIACNLAVTKQRTDDIDFSLPYLSTRQVLVQKKPENWRSLSSANLDKELIREAVDLAGKTVHVWKNSSFYYRLKNLSEEIGEDINIVPTQGNMNTQELIRRVSEGEIQYTIADENVAMMNLHFYDNIDVATPISVYQNIAFGLRKDAPEFNKALNEWLELMQDSSTFKYIKYKYFEKRQHASEASSQFSSVTGDKISSYDDLIRKEAEKVGWDWQVIAALIYQESKFVHQKEAWSGAYGIMQFMPETARAYGLTPESSPESHIVAGIKKLNKNFLEFLEEIGDSTEALKFSLATYNAGRGHVADARALAKKYNKDPNVWDGNVANFAYRLSRKVYYEDQVVKYGYLRGDETVRFVKEILERAGNYKNLYP